jgi:hypothetical protein
MPRTAGTIYGSLGENFALDSITSKYLLTIINAFFVIDYLLINMYLLLLDTKNHLCMNIRKFLVRTVEVIAIASRSARNRPPHFRNVRPKLLGKEL